MGKEVTRKVKQSDDESDEDVPTVPLSQSDNPWLGGSEKTQDSSQITSGYRKLWNSVNESKEARKNLGTNEVVKTNPRVEQSNAKKRQVPEIASKSNQEREDSAEELDEVLVRSNTMEDFENDNEDDSQNQKHPSKAEENTSQNDTVETATTHETQSKGGKKKSMNIDPNKFVTMKEVVIKNSTIPTLEEGNNEDDEEDQRRMTLAEAFADDDVIEQFNQEKKNIIHDATPKDIDLTLPGWGDWAGAGVKASKRKRKQFIIKAPPAPKRRDENIGNLIINEDKNVLLRRQQVIFLV